MLSIGINSDGSAKLAAKWQYEMSSWDTPSEAAIDSTVSIYDFSNGEWAIMKSKNSHGGFWHGGGTVVVKDSSGRINSFHNGHVCGDGNPLIFGEPDNLDSLYDLLAQADFQEFVSE